jgi:hypothetical protein
MGKIAASERTQKCSIQKTKKLVSPGFEPGTTRIAVNESFGRDSLDGFLIHMIEQTTVRLCLKRQKDR